MNNQELREEPIWAIEMFNLLVKEFPGLKPQYLSESEIVEIINLGFIKERLPRQETVRYIAHALANKIPKPPQYCECKEPKEDLSNGVHPGYCKHCHNLLPLDKHTLEQIRHTLNVIYNENPINFPQDNKEPMPIGGICLNCGREVCICKCPKDNKEPIGELELDPHREYPEWQRVMVKKINQTIRELNALSEIVRQR